MTWADVDEASACTDASPTGAVMAPRANSGSPAVSSNQAPRSGGTYLALRCPP